MQNNNPRTNTCDGDADLAYALSLQAEYDKSISTTGVMETDFLLAVSLQEQLNKDPQQTNISETVNPKEIVDERWELTDPNPDIHKLFVEYDNLFFGGRLVASGVAVNWSNRMTL